MLRSWGAVTCAVGPIGFVSVIFLRIVRSRYDYAGLAFELADGEAQLGRRTQRVEQIDRETVRSENVGHALGEHPRIVAAVVPHGHPDRFTGETPLQVVRKPLRGSAHRINVHPIAARAHDAPQTARTEFEILVETLHEFVHIILHQVFNLFLRIFVVRTVEPRLRLSEHQLFQFVFHKSIIFIYRYTTRSVKNFIRKYS